MKICLLCLWLCSSLCFGDLSVQFSSDSVVPRSKTYLTDGEPETCTEFEVDDNKKDLLFRVQVPDTEAELVAVVLVGKNLGCGDDLFVIPITEAEEASWQGIWIVCPLIKVSSRGVGKSVSGATECQYSCECAGGCKAIQILKRPCEKKDWSLCDISFGKTSPTPLGYN